MATIKYFIRGKADKTQVYISFTAGRSIKLQKKTDFVIDRKDWSDKTNRPKQTTAENKNLISNLNKLENFVFDQYNQDLANGILIDVNWLDNCIDKCFNRIEKTDNEIFINYLQYMIDNLNTREARGGKIGVSKGTIKNYHLFKGIFENYQKHLKKQIRFKDINKAFTDSFKTWLLNDKGYTVNYTGKQFEFIKTVCIDAQKNDIDVTPHSVTLKSFREQDKDRFIHTLSFDELDKIQNTEMPSDHLKEVKKWILIGCNIGQRGGDLLSITPQNIRLNAKGLYIDLIQQKTSKKVTIGVVQDYVVDILLNDFPKPVSLNKINKHIAKVCEIAKIDQKVKGYIIDPTTRKRTLVNLPKFNFITSHSFRRSFATNFYKMMPTPVLIGITGHSTEQMFLKYINQRSDKDANADMFMQFFEQMNKKQEPQMRVIKKVSNQ